MCGIIGIVNKHKPVVEEIIEALKRMEYRGYDSAGIIFGEKFELYKSIGSLENLKKSTITNDEKIGLGHTRWATHGEVNINNTHPIKINEYAIIHNGIVENTKEIVQITNYKPKTDTDTEILLSYFCYLIKNLTLEQTLETLQEKVKGSYAAAIIKHGKERIIWLKKGFSPIILATTKNGCCIVSDQEAVQNAEKLFSIESNGYGYINKQEVKILRGDYKELDVKNNIQQSQNNYETWMEKEIIDEIDIFEREKNLDIKQNFSKYSNVKIIGCGSSFFAAELGSIWLEEEGILSSSTIASEWNVAKTYQNTNQLIIFISQSGFTADTLSALFKAKSENCFTISLVNKRDSPIANNANEMILLNAGEEKSVASTKSFLAQIIKLYQLIKGPLPNIENKIKKMFELNLDEVAQILSKAKEIFILGKNKMNILAKEGMLKLTEICYVNAFSYPIGELKHGYISKITNETYSIILAPDDPVLFDKTVSNAQEITSRKGNVIWVSSTNVLNLKYFIKVDNMNYDEATFCYTIILQRLALKIGKILNRSIDKPRNLAKSVTVE